MTSDNEKAASVAGCDLRSDEQSARRLSHQTTASNSDTQDVGRAAWAVRIESAWRGAVDGVLETGRLLAEAKAALPHGAFLDMIENDLPFKPSTAQRLMKIAADERLANPAHVQHLPPHWGTLYELTDARQSPIAIEWTGDGLIGRLTIGGELWAAVEWSEKRQRWCIEDAEGRCLSHQDHVHGAEVDKAAAIALAESMIRDGQMPAPESARKNREERLRIGREKRQRQPAQIRKRTEREELLRSWSDASMKEWEARRAEDAAPPLYETLADVFDFADAELWKSNSFAALRPRPAAHVRAVIAELESDLAWEILRRARKPFCGLGATKERRQEAVADRKAETSSAIQGIEAKLARAREILAKLETEAAP